VGDFDLYAEKETTGEHLFHVTLSQWFCETMNWISMQRSYKFFQTHTHTHTHTHTQTHTRRHMHAHIPSVYLQVYNQSTHCLQCCALSTVSFGCWMCLSFSHCFSWAGEKDEQSHALGRTSDLAYSETMRWGKAREREREEAKLKA
jgi:hypothetical protein